MRKKQYIQPFVETVSVEETSLICGSGNPGGQIPSGQEENKPQPDSEGIIHGESKQSDSIIDWDNEDF